MTARVGPPKKSRLPWEKPLPDLSKYDWLTAVGLHPMHKHCDRDLRIANIVMQMADAETGLMWATQQTIAALAGVGDERQVRTTMQRFEKSGALSKARIADLQQDTLDALHEKMSGNRNKRGAVYKLRMFWAFETFEAYGKRKAQEPDHLRKMRELNRTTPVRCERTTPVRLEQDNGCPAYTTEGNYTDTENGNERKQDLASTREGLNPYALATGRAA
jgi:alkylated DNA nucleotide flippase Atl1